MISQSIGCNLGHAHEATVRRGAELHRDQFPNEFQALGLFNQDLDSLPEQEALVCYEYLYHLSYPYLE